MGHTSDISQAAAVSALLKRKAGVTPRPSGASNNREYSVIVRRGTMGGGASIAVGHSDWSADHLEQVADQIADILTEAGYVFERRNSRVDSAVHFSGVKKADLSRRRRVSLRLTFDVDPDQYQKVYGDLTAENTITLAVRDYVAQLLLNSPLAQEGVLLGGVDSSVNIHAQADR